MLPTRLSARGFTVCRASHMIDLKYDRVPVLFVDLGIYLSCSLYIGSRAYSTRVRVNLLAHRLERNRILLNLQVEGCWVFGIIFIGGQRSPPQPKPIKLPGGMKSYSCFSGLSIVESGSLAVYSIPKCCRREPEAKRSCTEASKRRR